jgi:hypothetical protein
MKITPRLHHRVLQSLGRASDSLLPALSKTNQGNQEEQTNTHEN